MKRIFYFLFLLLLTQVTFAESIDATTFSTPKQEQRYRALIGEIRCPVCQGQSIGGSNAGLAKDLREKVRALIVEQKTDDDIRVFMVERYGDFVVFKPPVNKNTYLLWFAPFVFLAFGLLFLIRSLVNKKQDVQMTDTLKINKAKDLLK
ncbi:Cytochrome c heme lyase subunit CcmL [uncultured Candidatus Thioglobus sp.]|nr:Cytochrome c heme lyase subunit CcmL [uncultured Candidatus Thioglobus sp.]